MSEVNVTIFDRNYRLAVTTGEEKMLEDCARQVNEKMLAVPPAALLQLIRLQFLLRSSWLMTPRSASMTLRKPLLRLRRLRRSRFSSKPLRQLYRQRHQPQMRLIQRSLQKFIRFAVSAKRHSSETQRWDRSSKVISRKPRKCGASYFSWIKFYAAVVFDHLREV